MANSTLGCGVVNTTYSAGIISTVDETGTRNIGVVTASAGSPPVALSGDPRILGFKHNGVDRAMVVSYTYSFGSPGTAIIGIYDPTSWSTPIVQKTSAAWGFSNPYGLVAIGDDLYVQDYDSGTITKIDMASSYTSSTVYTVTPTSGYTAHGNGMDWYNDGSTDYLVAVYSQVDVSYSYTNSILVILDITSSPVSASTVSINANAVSVSVDEDGFAHVCSSGGSQVAGGNGANSKLEIVDLNSPPFTVSATITATTTPSTFGDFVDTAFVAGSAYVLLANYNSTWTTYTYRIIKTTASALQGGSFGTNTNYSTTTSAGSTWLLAPDSSLLWFVSANIVNMIDTSVAIGSGAITALANATDGTSSGIGLGSSTINGNLNTASVVIRKTIPAKAGIAARSIARTKSAIKFVVPEADKEALEQSAAAKQK